MKHTVKFNFPQAGVYQAMLTGINIGQNKWSQSLQYVFGFNLLAHVLNGEWHDLDTPILYERCIQASRDNETLFNFLRDLGWPLDSDYRDMTFDIDGMRNFSIPVEVPRLFDITFIKGMGGKAAAFKSIVAHEGE